MKRLQEGIFAVLDEVWGDAISTRYFATGQAVDRFVKTSEGWFSIQFLHDGQRFNGIKGRGDNSVLFGVELRVVLHPPVHLLAFVSDHFPTGCLVEDRFAVLDLELS